MIAILEAKRTGLFVRGHILGNTGRVPFIDSTGLTTLDEVVADFQRRGTAVVFCELRSNVLAKLTRAGVIARAGAGCTVGSRDEFVARRAPAANPPAPE